MLDLIRMVSKLKESADDKTLKLLKILERRRRQIIVALFPFPTFSFSHLASPLPLLSREIRFNKAMLDPTTTSNYIQISV